METQETLLEVQKVAIIIGGGYSVKEGIELGLWDKIKDKEVWSLNFAYKTMPYKPRRELWADINFFKNHIEELQTLYQSGVKCIAKAHGKYKFIAEIETYYTTRDIKEAKEKMYIGSMGLVGFLALSVAVREKYDIVYALGYDFGTNSVKNDKTHYYQEKIHVLSSGVRHPEFYREENGRVREDVRDFNIYKNSSTKIYNVSLNSNIESFEKISYEQFFRHLV